MVLFPKVLVLTSKGRRDWQTTEHLGLNMQREGFILILEGSEERSRRAG